MKASLAFFSNSGMEALEVRELSVLDDGSLHMTTCHNGQIRYTHLTYKDWMGVEVLPDAEHETT